MSAAENGGGSPEKGVGPNPQNGGASNPMPPPDNEAQSPPLVNLIRAWKRCGTQDRALFMQDIGAKPTADEGGNEK